MSDVPLVLALNCGSSSVKVAVLDPSTGERLVDGLAERVGTAELSLSLSRGSRPVPVPTPTDVGHHGAVAAMVSALSPDEAERVVGVGHRIVHGGARFTESVVVDDDVLAGLESLIELAPLHAPGNVAGIRAAREALDVPQVAVFDTAFHRTLPPRAYRYAVPSAWFEDLGVRRFGFHGISHSYVAARAAGLLGVPPADLDLVSAHLGNGCSACAVRGGLSVDTTMGLTPLEGLMMGTRSGDVDPGALGYVGSRLGLSLADVVSELSFRSGLLGVSGVSNDMRSLHDAAAAGNDDAALAIDLFCYRVAKGICALAVSLERLDAIVLTGGIGENDVRARSRIMAHLAVLGVLEDEAANTEHGATTRGRISATAGPTVLVVPTDEELLIARETAALVT